MPYIDKSYGLSEPTQAVLLKSQVTPAIYQGSHSPTRKGENNSIFKILPYLFYIFSVSVYFYALPTSIFWPMWSGTKCKKLDEKGRLSKNGDIIIISCSRATVCYIRARAFLIWIWMVVRVRGARVFIFFIGAKAANQRGFINGKKVRGVFYRTYVVLFWFFVRMGRG